MNKRKVVELIIICLIGLTPLLWFNGNYVIQGHDTGLPLDPITHFQDRILAWTDRLGFGTDQSIFLPVVPIHGLEALVSSFGASLQLEQKITFVFWFLLPGLAMYYFASKLEKRFELKYFALPASILFMFNHFLLQGWFIAERTKFSLYAAVPLIFAFLMDWEDSKKNTLLTGILISLTIFLLNGGGSLPLYGGLLVSLFCFAIFYLIKEFSFKRIVRLIQLGITVGILSLVLNSYWIIPMIYFVKTSFAKAVTQAGGIGGVLGWLSYISQDSSLINLFRLQGIPEWYNNPGHPYSNSYLQNPFLIFVSYMLPVVAFLPLYLIKDKQKRTLILFFAFLALFSMIFIGGSHPPFGIFYILMVNFIPGFLAFRTPFYKFAPALWFSYAVLIGIMIDYVLQRLKIKDIYKVYFLYGLICIAIICYSFPFFSGKFFDYMGGQRSMRVVVPQYIFDFGKWSQTPDRIRIKSLVIPPPTTTDYKVDTYTWGYWSLTPLTSVLTNAPVINMNGFMTPEEVDVTDKLYKMMRNNEPGWQNLAKVLGINSFVVRKDYYWNSSDSPTDNPQVYEAVLKNSGVKLVKTFGKWDIYDLPETTEKGAEIKVVKAVNYLVGRSSNQGLIVSLPVFDARYPIFISGDTPKMDQKLYNLSNGVYQVPQCINCDLQRVIVDADANIPQFTKGSVFYRFTEQQDKKIEKKLSDEAAIKHYGYKSLRDLLGFQKTAREKKEIQILLSNVKNYGVSLHQMEVAANTYISNRTVYDMDLIRELSEVMRVEEAVLIDFTSSNDAGAHFSAEINNDLNNDYHLVKTIRNNLNDTLWETQDIDNKRYYLVSDFGDTYTIFWKPNDKNYKVGKDVTITINNKKETVKPVLDQTGWYTLGTAYIEKGANKIELNQPTVNLYTGASIVQIHGATDVACFTTNMVHAQKRELYKISFTLRNTNQDQTYFAMAIPEGKSPNMYETNKIIMKPSLVDRVYSFDNALPVDGNFYVAICGFPYTEAQPIQPIAQVINLKIRQSVTPDIVFYKKGDFSAPGVDYSYNRINQTKYTVDIKDNGQNIILLDKSFSPNWKLSGFNDQNSFTANGHINAWLINNGGQGVITYTIQDIVDKSFIIMVVSLVITIGGLLIVIIKRRTK
ncbi:MAG TPA: hypothetical protein VLF89_10050 [Candidatus Saccharimonadales bacterium]|nr:hypothetical protein [Candidatus Saccharimonadales bacterium]